MEQLKKIADRIAPKSQDIEEVELKRPAKAADLVKEMKAVEDDSIARAAERARQAKRDAQEKAKKAKEQADELARKREREREEARKRGGCGCGW